MSFFEGLFGICCQEWSNWTDIETLKYNTGQRIYIQYRECLICKKKKYRKEIILP